MSANRLTDREPFDLSAPLWDVAVVGAGPAGAMAALQLARLGRRVLVLDRQRFPREKVCGDGLIADSLACLKRIGLYEQVLSRGRRLAMAAIYSPGRIRLEVPGEVITLKRSLLDALLLDAARAAGAAFGHQEIVALDPGEGGPVRLLARGSDLPVRARYAILATGADTRLLGAGGLLIRERPSAVALRCYVRSKAAVEELIVSYDRSIIPGYAWIFPLAGGEYNIGCGAFVGDRPAAVDLRRMFATFVNSFPAARRIWAAAEGSTPLHGARLRCGLAGSRLGRGRLLVAGEAAGTTYPFTGEGIGKAMESGEYAARAVQCALDGDGIDAVAHYRATLEARLKPRYRGYRSAERWLARAWLSDFVARRAACSPRLTQALAAVLREKADPREVFSLAGVLKSLWPSAGSRPTA